MIAALLLLGTITAGAADGPFEKAAHDERPRIARHKAKVRRVGGTLTLKLRNGDEKSFRDETEHQSSPLHLLHYFFQDHMASIGYFRVSQRSDTSGGDPIEILVSEHDGKTMDYVNEPLFNKKRNRFAWWSATFEIHLLEGPGRAKREFTSTLVPLDHIHWVGDDRIEAVFSGDDDRPTCKKGDHVTFVRRGGKWEEFCLDP